MPVRLRSNPVKKERIVTNRNSQVSGDDRFMHRNPKLNNSAALPPFVNLSFFLSRGSDYPITFESMFPKYDTHQARDKP
jgi:hypothetical protein